MLNYDQTFDLKTRVFMFTLLERMSVKTHKIGRVVWDERVESTDRRLDFLLR